MRLAAFVLAALSVIPAAAQRDFLNAEEADQIREAQEPNLRLQLYVKFAQTRLELLKHFLAENKPGRSAVIHETLEDYTKIIEAIDTVADDALKRRLDVQVGMKAVTDGEKAMLAALETLDRTPAKDRQRYEFAMKQALDTTRDSLEMSLEDLNERKAGVAAREDRERKEREAVMQPKELEEKRASEKKETEAKRKAPTLRRKGEVVTKKP